MYILNKIKSVFLCSINLLKYYFCFYICLFLIIFSQDTFKFNDDFAFSLGLILATISFLLLLKSERKSPIKYINLHKIQFNVKILLILIFSFSLSLLSLGIGILLENSFSPDNSSNSQIYFYSILHIAIIAPICEEIFFRGIIFMKLKAVMPLSIAILLQGILFGIMHGPRSGHLVQSLLAIISGTIYALVYYYTNNLTTSILIHICYNSLIILYNYSPFIFSISPYILLSISLFGFVFIIKFKKCLFFSTTKHY